MISFCWRLIEDIIINLFAIIDVQPLYSNEGFVVAPVVSSPTCVLHGGCF